MYREDGVPTCSAKEVEDEFIRFYKGLLGSSSSYHPIDPKVLWSGHYSSSDQAMALTDNISSHEIADALFSIGDDKSPGLNGFSSLFFKKSWNIIGYNFCKAILEFFI